MNSKPRFRIHLGADRHRSPAVGTDGGPRPHLGSEFNEWDGRGRRPGSILVPLDGSVLAEHALPIALAIARRSHATIRLALVHAPSPSGHDPWSLDCDDQHKQNQEAARRKRMYLHSVIRRIRRRDDIDVLPRVYESERIADQLRDAAADADLVVMATRGRGPATRLLLGSMADSLLRRASCPILLVRGYNAPVDLTGDPIPGRILVPLDDSGVPDRLLETVGKLAQLSGAAVTLLHVSDRPKGTEKRGMPDPYELLRRGAASLRPMVPDLTLNILVSDEPRGDAILSWTRERDVDLIAMTATPRNGLSSLTHRTLADVALRTAGIPVLVHGSGDDLAAELRPPVVPSGNYGERASLRRA